MTGTGTGDGVGAGPATEAPSPDIYRWGAAVYIDLNASGCLFQLGLCKTIPISRQREEFKDWERLTRTDMESDTPVLLAEVKRDRR